MSDSRLRGLSIRKLKIIDSTTIRLFSDLLQGVGRNPQDGSRKKGGIKVHTLMDAFSGVAEFVRITAAKANDGRMYVFITNNFRIAAQTVATIYKRRWMIELLFKQIKQNFPIRYFWGENENAIRIQVYCVLIAQLLMVVIRKKAQTKKSFANIITIIRLHLMSYVELLSFIKDTYKAWQKAHPPPVPQLQLL